MTFIAGALSVLFTVSDGTLFVSIVPPDSYVDGQSLIYGSRAFSFMGGPSVGGLLVEALTAPFAIIADALSFVGSALQLAMIKPAEPPSSDGADGVTAGLRFVWASPIIRASLTGVAVINFFNMMFSALFMLYAVRMLHVRPGVLGVVIGAGAVGGMIASLTAKRLGNRLGIGLVYVVGCFVFTLPLALVPLAASVHGVAVLLMLFAAEFASGFGVMVLDISIGAIFAMVIPDTMRSRVSGAFQAINYGTRPAGALIGGRARRLGRPAARAVGGGGGRGGGRVAAAAVAAARVPDADRAARGRRGRARGRRIPLSRRPLCGLWPTWAARSGPGATGPERM